MAIVAKPLPNSAAGKHSWEAEQLRRAPSIRQRHRWHPVSIENLVHMFGI